MNASPLVTSDTQAANVKVASLKLGTNDRGPSYNKLLLRDDVVLTPQTPLTDVFLSISKLKKYFNNQQLAFLQSLNGNQFIEIAILIVLQTNDISFECGEMVYV